MVVNDARTRSAGGLRADRLRRNEPIPLYYQVELELRRAIEEGQFANGQLPTEEILVQRYRVSRQTIRQALGRIQQDGLIERFRSRGTFVRHDVRQKLERQPTKRGYEADLLRQGVVARYEVLSTETVPTDQLVAELLQLPLGSPCTQIKRLAWAGEQPYCLEEHYYPSNIGAQILQHDITTGPLVDLRQQISGSKDHSSMRVEAQVATTAQARLLSVHRGDALLISVHTFWNAGEQPQEVLLLAFAGDRFVLKFDLPLESEAGRCWERL